MLENIRRIGMFMIVAQTAIHFAAGKQYERYMKIIAGVIVLLQFISPFVSSAGEIAGKWQAETEQMMSEIERRTSEVSGISYGYRNVQETVVQQIEEEIKLRLNDLVSEEECRVTDVVIDLEKVAENVGNGDGTGGNSWVFDRVEVTLVAREETGYEPNAEDGIRPEGEAQQIHIDEIVIDRNEDGQKTDARQEIVEGQETDREILQSTRTQAYRKLFAQALGIGEDRVEVIVRGGQ